MTPATPRDDNDSVNQDICGERMNSMRRDLEREVSDRVSHEEQCERSKAIIFERLGKIERLMYIGMGGVIVLGGIFAFLGKRILEVLTR